VGNRNIANELLLRKYFHEKNSSIAIHPSFRKVQAHIFSPRLVPEEEDDTVHQPFEFGISDRWDNTNGQNSGQTSWAAEQQGNSKGFYPEGIVIPNCTVPSQSMGSKKDEGILPNPLIPRQHTLHIPRPIQHIPVPFSDMFRMEKRKT
jgi:hypothetical protein